MVWLYGKNFWLSGFYLLGLPVSALRTCLFNLFFTQSPSFAETVDPGFYDMLDGTDHYVLFTIDIER